MKLLTAGIIPVILLCAGVAFAQSQFPGNAVPMNSVYVGADGKFESAPDTALIQFNIGAQGDTSRAAYDKAAAATEQVRQVLKSNGIDPKAAEFGFFAIQPMYDWKNPKHKVIGYQVASNVSLKLHDFSKVGPITQQMADIDSTENQSLSYTLENIDAAKLKATEDAMRKARAEANAVAVAGGRTLGDLLYAAVDVNEPVVPVPMRPMAMASRGATPPPAPTEGFTPQLVTINAHVNAMYGLK
ncbi:MAG TPA: SIMPL domain-containing protein [Candidatus Angelobacter sp.]